MCCLQNVFNAHSYKICITYIMLIVFCILSTEWPRSWEYKGSKRLGMKDIDKFLAVILGYLLWWPWVGCDIWFWHGWAQWCFLRVLWKSLISDHDLCYVCPWKTSEPCAALRSISEDPVLLKEESILCIKPSRFSTPKPHRIEINSERHE